jgi:hypothetical protein
MVLLKAMVWFGEHSNEMLHVAIAQTKAGTQQPTNEAARGYE